MTDVSFCRLEYLTAEGWVVGHAGVALVDPERYVARLSARGKFGRCTVLSDDDLQTEMEVFVSPNIPEDLTVLVKSETNIPRVPDPAKDCPVCDEEHPPPYDGTCLL